MAAVISVTGCKQMVSLPDRGDQSISQGYFASDQKAIDAVNGLKANAMRENGTFLNGAGSIYPGMSADELKPTGSAKAWDDFAENRLGSGNIYVATIYNTAYSLIAQVNLVLQGLGGNNVSPAVCTRLRGECYCWRASAYCLLLGLFGDVPLVIGTNVDTNAILARSPAAIVYSRIIDDLQAADSLLPGDYVPGDKDVVSRTSPNKWVARGLLARIYLYQERWQDAERMATSVLGRADLVLEQSPDSVFLSSSREIMWQLVPWGQGVNAEATYFLPAGANLKPSFAIRSTLLNAFEPGDRRKAAWTATNSSGVVYPFKYKQRTGGDNKECYVMMRLAEQYLIRAEARGYNGDLAGAIDDLNTIRLRAGLSPLKNGLSRQEVLSAVGQERRIELMCEWGHRWRDLKRTGQADSLLGPLKPAWKPTAALYPFPAEELKRDSHLVQNPGY